MQLIVGLGNPGSQYVHTRHNIGFRIADAVAVALSTTFSYQKKALGHVAKKGDIFLLKPETFMNRSGESVRAALQFYGEKEQKRTYEQLFVIHDDLDIALGSYKIQFAKGPKVHNGLRSITQQLGTDQYHYVRIGVENRGVLRHSISGADYVLASFSTAEEDTLRAVTQQVVQQLLKLLYVE